MPSALQIIMSEKGDLDEEENDSVVLDFARLQDADVAEEEAWRIKQKDVVNTAEKSVEKKDSCFDFCQPKPKFVWNTQIKQLFEFY
jgi:hypothetical protein